MADNKVKISNILENQLPEFILDDNPLFKEFLEQYYLSQDHEYGTIDLADHIADLKDIDTFSKLPFALTAPKTTSVVYNIDDIIYVTNTAGFPKEYGLFKIGNEIITYTGKTATSFTGCIRGFSGIDSLGSANSPEFFNFNVSNTEIHAESSTVTNLGLVFLAEFYKKYKNQFLPGFENRQFQSINIDNILSRARDFYNSKGTDSSLKILFSVLYGKFIEVVKPFDNTILASSSDWSLSDIIVVEPLEGDVSKLEATTVLQDSTTNPTAKGTIARIQDIFLNRKRFHKIFFTKGSIENSFKTNKKTKVLGVGVTNTTLTVDSTFGFPESGRFYNKGTTSKYSEVTYQYKNGNQFFGCVGLSTSLVEGDPIIDDTFLYGYENNDTDKLVKMRVVGTITDVAKNADITSFFTKGDKISVQHLGEKVDPTDPRFNRWFYNNVTYTNVKSTPSATTIITEVDHYLNVGDRVDILLKDGRNVEESNREVTAVTNRTQFQIGAGSLTSDKKYIIKKKLDFVNTTLNNEGVLSNIQNSFLDNDGNTYVAFSGYPGYDNVTTTNRSKEFTSSAIDQGTDIINIPNHNFINGEKLYYEKIVGSSTGGIPEGNYFVNVIDNNRIRLSLSLVSLDNKIYFDISGVVANEQHKLTPTVLHGKSLVIQNNFKRIYKEPKLATEHNDIIGPIGVALNGVEFYSPIGEDSIFYGQLDGVNILNKGVGYNVVNPPQIGVADTSGTNAKLIGHFVGKIEDIILTNAGFDFAETPTVTISGGNGTQATAEARMRGFTYSESFNDFSVNLVTNRITISGGHKFSHGEEVTYVAAGTPIGIGSTNVGFSTNRLTSGATYFISKFSDTEFSLAPSKEVALAGVAGNQIDFTAQGNQEHTLRSRKIRKVIDTINIVDSTDDFSSRKVVIDSQIWPPIEQKDIYSNFVGINTENNYIYARNHSFKNGDNLRYSVDGTAIGGLSTTANYKVKVLDDDRFMLSEAGTATTISSVNYDRNIYVDITSVGVGTHTFKYPEITVSINGLVSVGDTSVIPSYYNATANPIVSGKLDNVFIQNGGVGYGVTNIINYQRKPEVNVLTGKNADIKAIISGGKISSVYIADSGVEYTTPPTVNVVGSGRGAKLTATIVNGSITAINIINPGTGYEQDTTTVEIIPTGTNAQLDVEVHEWKLNNVERFKKELQLDIQDRSQRTNRELVQLKSPLSINGNKLVSFYPGTRLRQILNDNLNNSLQEKTTNLAHSPIIGWAYDGNPIYGPYGNGNAIIANGAGGIIKMVSSYEKDAVIVPGLRPPGDVGYYTQDFVYKANGTLDEYNGRYLTNTDFPNGTYAYFATIDSNGNLEYPYITKSHYNQTDNFNYNILIEQSDENVNNGLYKRNVTHLGLNDPFREYPFLSDPLKSNTRIDVDYVNADRITSIDVENSGSGYKVGEQINLNDSSVDAEIEKILGKEIESIVTTTNEFKNTIFSIQDGKITGITTIPHTMLDTDVVEISGISSSSYKNIEGFRPVGVSTINTSVQVAIGATTVTGITTDIKLGESVLTGKFKSGDIIQIGNEQMLIANVDLVNNKYKVTRLFSNTAGSAHTAGKLVTRLPKEFTFNVNGKLENKNINFAHKKNFAASAIGIGSAYTSSVVGVAGSTNITVSIPPRAIYAPGHQFKTGDPVSLVSVGGTITASATAALTNEFDLSTVNLFVVKVASDFIGLATSKAGVASSSVFFTNNTTGKDHTLEVIKTNITGIVKKTSAQVTLIEPHSLKVNDEVKLDVTPSKTQNFVFKFNPVLKKLVVDPQSFANSDITTSTDEITIANHGFKTGDIVVYTNSVGVATPLQSNKEYYVIKISEDVFKLAETSYSANVFPYQNVDITEQGHGTHVVSKLSPKLEIFNGGKVAIAVSDSSLSGYDINLYQDNEFSSRYESTLIERTGTIGDSSITTRIVLDVKESLPKNLYYRIEGEGSNYTNTYPVTVSDYSNICVVDSKFNQNYKLTSVGSTTFDFTLVGSAETTSYTSAGFSSAFYYTSSLNDRGGIHSVDIVNPGYSIKKIPVVTSIGTTTGKNALLNVNGPEIGEIEDVTVVDTGIEFLEDSTLAPKADAPVILKLRNTFTLGSVGITTSGENYTTAPTVIAIGNSTILTRTEIEGSSVSSVEVIVNDTNLNEDLKLIAINNTNGVRVTGATSVNQLNTISLRAPVNGFEVFPFAVNDKIFVENIGITDSADGYNSSDYGYRFFTVTGINTIGGTESVTYSIAGIGSTGGTYNNAQNAAFGRVIKSTDLASFTPIFKEITFSESEKVTVGTGITYGFVTKDGWDPESKTLKLTGVVGDFGKNSIINGIVGNNKATVEEKYEFDFDLKIGSTSSDYGIWKDDIGKLNFDSQRIHDNDYYQRFSYSIRGEIPLQNWEEAVNSLDHTAGYKNFSDFQIITYPPARASFASSDTSEINLNVELSSSASVHTRMYYDLASEDTDTSNFSKIIKFDSKVITDYNESRTNKVLMIDDISSQFTGVGNSSGQLIGISTFNIFNNSNTLLYHTVEPGAGIETNNGASMGVITINDHNFNTGERLVYDPTNRGEDVGQHISIVQTSSTGSGLAATDRLPESVYAIKLTDDTFRVAVGKSEAEAGLGVTFTNTVGIGSTHSFSTETDLASSRSIITIDNIIQSPLARKDVSVGLTTAVGIGSTQITVNDVSNIVGKTIIRIENELLKVQLVGVGATNVLNVQRGQMGTVATAHTVGAATTIVSGDYRINKGKIYFSEPPYGPAGIGSLTTRSSFTGRIYYKLNYDNNLIMDDISEEFDGTKDQFDLKSNGQQVTGISTSFGAVLIDNIFQKPFYGDVGSILESDYRIVGTGETIDFTGTRKEDLPKGGIINEFTVGVGSNYQVPRQAIGIAVVNGSGVITSVSIGGTSAGGAGYLFPPVVSIADTLGNGVGAAVTATVGSAGTISGFTINNGGTGYSQANPPLVTIDPPSPYKNLPLIGGTGSGAKMDVVVGTGGSIISFNMSNRGIGYSVDDVLELSGLPFNPVGVGSTNMLVTVKNKYQDKFAGWTFGQMLELDDFSNQFNGFRKSFLITRTIAETEYYSIVAQDGSGIVLANNLMIFLNDVLQKPNDDYEFNGGTRITFKEAPKPGSKFKIYLYTGSDQDFVAIDVDETVKPGDRLRLQTQDNVPSQEKRIIYELIASDTVETETYAGVGIVTDSSFNRPVEWTKQTSDIIIDGQIISKERNYLELQYFPATNIIASVATTSTKLYVNDSWAFKRVDDLGQTLNDIRIVGFGTTAVVEEIKKVTYAGDFGTITSIGASTVGIGTTTSPRLDFILKPDSTIYDPTPNDKQVAKPGISTGDFFVIRNTTLGAGVTSIDKHISNIVSTGTSFVDNIYMAHEVVSIGTSEVRVSTNVDSLAGINTLTQPTDVVNYGTYSWGVINTGSRSVATARSFTHNTNGIAGIETSAHVSRLLQLRVSY